MSFSPTDGIIIPDVRSGTTSMALTDIVTDEDGHGHGHKHYTVVSDPIKKGDDKVKVLIHGAELITDIEDASDDPAAVG